MGSFAEKIGRASDKSFDVIYRAVLKEKAKRELAILDSMPEPTHESLSYSWGNDYLGAYRHYAKKNNCSTRMAKAVIDKWRKERGINYSNPRD